MRTYIRVNDALQVVEVIEAEIAAGFLISPRSAITVGDTLTEEEAIMIGASIPQASTDPCECLIDIGSFFDRFGAAKMDVLTSDDVNVKAVVTDAMARHWIDLKLPEVALGLRLIGMMVPSVTLELQDAILNAPVTLDENRVLRRLYF